MSNIINVQDILENKISLQEAKEMIVMHKGEAYTFFDEGNTRHVYSNADKTKVIKLLKSTSSFSTDYNQEEADIYENASEEHRTKMAPTTLVDGLIEQDFVTPIKFGGKKLSIPQRLFANHCRGEVGWTKEDTLVCFDLDEYMKY